MPVTSLYLILIDFGVNKIPVVKKYVSVNSKSAIGPKRNFNEDPSLVRYSAFALWSIRFDEILGLNWIPSLKLCENALPLIKKRKEQNMFTRKKRNNY